MTSGPDRTWTMTRHAMVGERIFISLLLHRGCIVLLLLVEWAKVQCHWRWNGNSFERYNGAPALSSEHKNRVAFWVLLVAFSGKFYQRNNATMDCAPDLRWCRIRESYQCSSFYGFRKFWNPPSLGSGMAIKTVYAKRIVKKSFASESSV